MKDSIIETLTRIEAKLDTVIKALHEYDGNDEYGEDILNWNVDGAERILPCIGHDKASWDDEEATNKRMDIIGQNGNEGSHYVTNEEADEDAATFNDYGMRVVKDNDNNTQDKDKRTGEDKKRNKRKYYKPKQKN